MSGNDPIVGIDLGTTYSLVAIADGPTGPRVIADEQGRAACPSVVRFSPDGPPVVGWEAREEAARFPDRTVASVKRLMGRSRVDAAGDLPFLMYEVVEGEGATARVRLPWTRGDGAPAIVTPQEVSALILSRLRGQAERALGVPVRRAVVTVPAYFDDAQRQATRDAGRLAGLDVVRIVNEPTAAALAYGLGLRASHVAGGAGASGGRIIVVYDFGGGTFDVSVLRLSTAPADAGSAVGADLFQVLATAGDTRLGGDDIDRALCDAVMPEAVARLGRPLEPGETAALIAACERAKIDLSERERTVLRADLGGTAFERHVTRAEFEALIAPLVERTLAACRRALRDARRDLDGRVVDAVVMVGGSTRVPLVRRRVGELFGVEPYTALDPDQVVALGAAVQGSVLAGVTRDALLLDVIPLSLGLETAGGAVAKIIMRNTPVPARASEMFSTSVDGQGAIRLAVYQGEREMAADCRLLGTFTLRGIPPMPAGIPQLAVEFAVDASGILSVSAVERRSGVRAAIQVVPNHGLSRVEVERMERESVLHAREDMARHRIADLVANGRLDAHWVGKQLEKHGGALDESRRGAVAGALEALREMLARAEQDWRSVDPDALHRAKEVLDRASVPLHEVAIASALREADASGNAPSVKIPGTP